MEYPSSSPLPFLVDGCEGAKHLFAFCLLNNAGAGGEKTFFCEYCRRWAQMRPDPIAKCVQKTIPRKKKESGYLKTPLVRKRALPPLFHLPSFFRPCHPHSFLFFLPRPFLASAPSSCISSFALQVYEEEEGKGRGRSLHSYTHEHIHE